MELTKEDLEFYEEIALGFEFLAYHCRPFNEAKSFQLWSRAQEIRRSMGDSPCNCDIPGLRRL